jgi:hypothetical protein
MVTRLLVGCFFVISSTFVQASDILFVSSRLAPVYAQANLGSRILTRLTRNTEIEVVSPKGIWLQIIYNGQQGWISRYSVTANSPPENQVSIFDRLKRFFDNGNSRERMTLISTAGGIRGLSDFDDEDAGMKDFTAVQFMESIQPDDDQVASFISGN